MALNSEDVQGLAQAIRTAVEETAPQKQVHISRYIAQTPWNPTGTRVRPELRGRFFQNGRLIQDDRLTADEINKLNKLKPGRYFDRKVEVLERSENGDVTVEIRYSNKSMEQRMEMKNLARNLNELLDGILAETKPEKAAK